MYSCFLFYFSFKFIRLLEKKLILLQSAKVHTYKIFQKNSISSQNNLYLDFPFLKNTLVRIFDITFMRHTRSSDSKLFSFSKGIRARFLRSATATTDYYTRAPEIFQHNTSVKRRIEDVLLIDIEHHVSNASVLTTFLKCLACLCKGLRGVRRYVVPVLQWICVCAPYMWVTRA